MRSPGFTIMEAAIGGAVLLAGLAALVQLSRITLDSVTSSSKIQDTQAAELMLRSQASLLKCDPDPVFGPTTPYPYPTVPPLKVGNWWYFVVAATPSKVVVNGQFEVEKPGNGANSGNTYYLMQDEIFVYASDSIRATASTEVPNTPPYALLWGYNVSVTTPTASNQWLGTLIAHTVSWRVGVSGSSPTRVGL